MTRHWTLLLALLVLAISACTNDGGGTKAAPGGTTTGPTDLTTALLAIEQGPRYQQSDWGYLVLDQKTGEVLASQSPVRMFDAGSTMKTFAVSAALEHYGNDYVFRTPVYRAGTQSGDTLNGNLVLVGSGDLSFGLRKQPDGSLYYENLPELDHSYANVGLPGAVEPPGDPLGALDELAASVRAAGVTRVNGDVVIDDRLFMLTTARRPRLAHLGQREPHRHRGHARLRGRPGDDDRLATQDSFYTVETQATTVDAKETTALEVTEPTPGHLVVTGKIAAGNTPTLVVKEITDPSAFARTAFIEVLQRAGVTVTATPTGRTLPRCCRPRTATRPPTSSVSTCRRISPRTSS